MSKQPKDELLSSNYDGIEEFDNDLPRWWVALFAITVLFSAAYPFYYHFGGPGLSPHQLLSLEMERADKLAAERAKAAGPEVFGENEVLALAKNPAEMERAKGIYVARCAACHGPDGGGIVGPNLTDRFWIHGASVAEIHKVIENGVLEKGMLPWKGVIPPADIKLMVAYVWSLRGSTPANPKAPQGDEAKS